MLVLHLLCACEGVRVRLSMSGAKRSGTTSRKGHLHTGDLIALGSKSGGSKSALRHPDRDDPKPPMKAPPTGPTSSSGGPPVKKFKGSTGESSGGGLFSDPIRVSQANQSQSASAKSATGPISKGSHSLQGGSPTPGGGVGSTVIEVRSGELLPAFREAISSGNSSKAAKLLAGALRQLKLSRLKPDLTLNSSLTTIAKENPESFSTPAVVEGLVAVLRRETSVIFKAKSNSSVYVLTSQLLLTALRGSADWPESLAKVYVEDSLGDRVWVDVEQCKCLVDNVCTLFQTRPYSPTGAKSGGGESVRGVGGEGVKSVAGEGGGAGEESGGTEETESENPSSMDVEVKPRFSAATSRSLRAHVLQMVNEQLGRHSMPADTVPRNLLRFLMSAVGFSELRLLVAQKIDAWIQNPKLVKLCQELLMTVAVNTHQHSPDDLKVIEALLTIRLKTKLFSTQFVACMKELISSHSSNLATVMKGVVTNELGQFRTPSNMALISMMIHNWPEEAAKLLGNVFQDFLARKEDYLRALRGFLREVVRVVRNEFSFPSFTRALMSERSEPLFTQLEPSHKERMALSLADLVACASMLTASMLIREAYGGFTKGERAMVPQLSEFFTSLGLIQRDGVWWLHTVVPGLYRPQPVDYKACLKKVLFLEPVEAYSSKDNWPPEADRSLIHHLMAEACLKEDTLMRVLVIGLTRELPLAPADAMDIADKLVARAANAHTEDIPRLPRVERKELFNAIFDISSYRPPANIQLPEDYQPPNLAISKLYWKGWILLLVLAAFNPKTVGAIAWNEYPMLKSMMEMVMTSTYTFPTSTTVSEGEGGVVDSRENILVKEAQLAKREKESILEYENHLASSSATGSGRITEGNSYLLNQVTQLHPKGPARRIPPPVIDLIKTVNRTLRLGHILCLSRSPDFLLDIIKKQGTMESMKWLNDLVEASHSSLEVLPIPCLCEFLMAGYQDKTSGGVADPGDSDSLSHRTHYKRKKSAKDKVEGRHRKLIGQLKNILVGADSSSEECSGVLEYFLDKLSQSHITPRKLAQKALCDILTAARRGSHEKSGSFSEDTEDEDTPLGTGGKQRAENWLTESLPNLTHFVAILPKIYPLILRACLVETNLQALRGYINFLTQYPPHEKLYQSAVEMSRVMVDRFMTVRKLFVSSYCDDSTVATDNMSTFRALLSMLKSALMEALHTQTSPELSGSSDFLLINFPGAGEKGIIHLALVEAIFLFLSCDLAQKSNPENFKYFLELFFPSGSKKPPEAFTVESKEPVSLPPSSVIPHLLVSTNQRILDAVVDSASPSQLTRCIQQFGCPVESVEKVLGRLDRLCDDREASVSLRRSVDNPALMANCVEVQFMRGIQAGKTFLTFLQGIGSFFLASGEPSDVQTILEDSSEKVTSPAFQVSKDSPLTLDTRVVDLEEVSVEKMQQRLLKIFTPSLSQLDISASEIQEEIEHALKALVLSSHEATAIKGHSSKDSINAQMSSLVKALDELVSGGSVRRQFLEGMIRHRFSLTLLRLVTKIHCLCSMEGGLFQSTIKQMLSLLDAKRTVSIPGLTVFRSVLSGCAERLGVEREGLAEGLAFTQLTSQVKRTCKEVECSQNLFAKESSLVKLVSDAIQGGMFSLVEDVLTSVAKRAILLQLEPRCISFLHKIKMATSSRQTPLPLQCFPELISRKSSDADGADGGNTMATNGQSMSMVVIGDLSGLLVDWLEILDPQIVHLSPEVSMEMTFGIDQGVKTPTIMNADSAIVSVPQSQLLSGQGYLLGRLTHGASWSVLIKSLSFLLDSKNSKQWLTPSIVLDFIWACLHKPSLWQERVKKEAVVDSSFSLGINDDCCLVLTPSQLECLVGYILKEAAGYIASIKGLTSLNTREERELSIEAKEVIYARLPLLMACCHGNEGAVRVVVKCLQANTSFPSLSWQLLVQLYHANERVMFTVDQPDTLSVAALSLNLPSKLDTELHYLLSAMASASLGAESRDKMSSAALLCRKISILHPALMLRQLPLMGWLLRGRAHLTVHEFKNQNHKQVFVNTFSILEQLQPLVFRGSQAESLNACLEAFFEFLKNQCLESKKIKHQTFVNSFANFLVNYAEHNRERAAPILFENMDTLRSLSEVYTNKKSNLKSLVDCFPKRVEGASEVKGAPLTYSLIPPVNGGHSLSHEQVMPFLKKLESGRQREDILKVLHDLEETSHHSVDILKHFVPELCRIIQDPELASCTVAHKLLLRHFKRTPSAVGDLLTSFISCLESRDLRVVMAAVGSVKDLVLLCKGKDAQLLLSLLFRLSVQPSLSCTGELTKAVEACTSHTFR